MIASDEDTTLYLKGEDKSSSLGVEEILLLIDGYQHIFDKIKLTVVEEEYDVVHRVFIPYNWVNIPHPLHANEVAKGDSRGFSPLSGTHRVQQTFTVHPHKDLSSNRLSNIEKDAGETHHFHNDDLLFHTGEKHSHLEDPISFIWHAATPTSTGTANVNSVNVNLESSADSTVVEVNINGSATEPQVLLAAPIDWDFDLTIDASDPINPVYSISGAHDGFPAYEIYINALQENGSMTTVLQWLPDIDDGVGKLFGGADNDIEEQTDEEIE